MHSPASALNIPLYILALLTLTLLVRNGEQSTLADLYFGSELKLWLQRSGLLNNKENWCNANVLFSDSFPQPLQGLRSSCSHLLVPLDCVWSWTLDLPPRRRRILAFMPPLPGSLVPSRASVLSALVTLVLSCCLRVSCSSCCSYACRILFLHDFKQRLCDVI